VHPSRPILVGVALLGLASCARGRAGTGVNTATSSHPPLPPDTLPPEVARAERLLRALRPNEALDLLEAAGGIDVEAPERSWILIDLLASRARAREARERTAALRDGPMASVLRAHARRIPNARLNEIGPAFSAGTRAWANLESAFAHADAGDRVDVVLGFARDAARDGPLFVRREAMLLAARQALEDDRGALAAEFADAAAALDPADPRAAAAISRVASLRGRRDEAVLAAVTALNLQPDGPRAARRLADLVREDPGPQVEARVRDAAAAWARRPARGAELEALLGLLAERAGDLSSARARYQLALEKGADPVPVDRRLRVLRFRAGDVSGAIELLRRAVPDDVFADPENRLAPAWADLFARAAACPTRGPATAATQVEALARALLRVGGVDDAEALLDGVAGESARALRASCARELAFERALRREVEEGYRAPAEGRAAPTLARLLDRMAEAAATHLDPASAEAFRAPSAGMRSVPLIGRWLDHSVATTSPVVEHFRKFGRYVLVGQRSGKAAEVIVLSLASLAPAATVRTQGRVFRHDVAIGYDRSIRSFVDFQGGTLSGAALPDGVWLDADAARRQDHGLRAALAIDPTLLPHLDRAAVDPSPPDGIDGVLALDETAGLALRLVRRHLARTGGRRWGSFGVLRAHEFGHVLDLERHLPIAQGLPSTAALVAGEGFALRRVEARLEGRAQLAALCDARDPDLALVDLVAGLPDYERVPEAHARGYRAVVTALLERLLATAAAHPSIDPTRKLLPQLDRLDPEELRGLGLEVARAGFTVR